MRMKRVLPLLALLPFAQPVETAAVCSFEVIAGEKLVVLDWDGACHRSADGGKTWADSEAMWMRETLAVSNEEIWGLTANSLNEKVAVSFDGAKSWQSVKLEKPAFHPVEFIGVHDGAPLIVDAAGQVRQWKHSESLSVDGTDWMPVGTPNQDHKGFSGCLVDKTLYVGSVGSIWCSTNLGSTWVAFDVGMKSPVVEFAASASSCWAATRDGVVFQATSGQPKWERIASLPNVFIVFSMIATEENVVLSGEQDSRAFVAVVHPDGKVESLASAPGKQAYRIGIDKGKNLLVATDEGLFRGTGDSWTPVWPAR
jgi:hypothetical protein